MIVFVDVIEVQRSRFDIVTLLNVDYVFDLFDDFLIIDRKACFDPEG